MIMTEAYVTYNKDGIEINRSVIDGQNWDSVVQAYEKCIEHVIECLKAVYAEIVEVDWNRIWYKSYDEVYCVEVWLYDEDDELIRF